MEDFKMKSLIFIFLLIPFFGFSQKEFPLENSFYLGTSVNSDVSSNAFIQFESRSEWVKLQLTYLTNFRLTEHRLNAKLGVRPLNWRKEDLGLWIFMPYLNMNLETFGYNSPFSFELQWQKRLAIILDTNFKQSQIQVRFRQKLFVQKKTFKKVLE